MEFFIIGCFLFLLMFSIVSNYYFCLMAAKHHRYVQRVMKTIDTKMDQTILYVMIGLFFVAMMLVVATIWPHLTVVRWIMGAEIFICYVFLATTAINFRVLAKKVKTHQ